MKSIAVTYNRIVDVVTNIIGMFFVGLFIAVFMFGALYVLVGITSLIPEAIMGPIVALMIYHHFFAKKN